MIKRYARLLTAVFVGLATFAVYLPSLRHDFVNWDDELYVVNNFNIRTLDLGFLKWAFTDFSTSGYWQPLVWMSYALDYMLWGLKPFGYHLGNILFHAANTTIVVIVAAGLIRAADLNDSKDRSQVLIAAGVTGLLFGLHPLHVESVAWISERKDLLCSLFFLLSVLAYMQYAVDRKGQSLLPGSSNSAGHSFLNRWYVATLVLFVLSLAAKPMAVMLPLIFLMMDLYPLQRNQDLRPLVIEKMPFFAVSIIVSLGSIAGQKMIGALGAETSATLPVRIAVAFKSLIVYLWKMLAPLDLMPFYPYPKGVSLFTPDYLIPAIVTVVITVASLIAVRKQKVWITAWGYYVISLVPVLGLVQVGRFPMADRFTYLPGIGPFLLAGLGAAWLWDRTKPAGLRTAGRTFMVVISVCMSILLVWLTQKQIAIWKNGITLWSHVISKEPLRIPFAYDSRGNAFKAVGQIDLAIKDYTSAISLDGTAQGYFNNRGIAYRETGQLERALADHTRAISLKPELPYSYNNRGLVFKAMGQLDRAMEDFNKAISLAPDYADAYTSRGWTYQDMGRTDRAIEDYDRAIALDPTKFIAFNNRGMIFQETGQLAPALENFTESVRLNPFFAQAYTNRGLVYEQMGQPDLALRDYAAAIKVNPSFAGAYNNRGLVYEDMGRTDRAVEDYSAAIKLKPDDYLAYYNRGIAYRKMGDAGRAADDFKSACNLGSRSACEDLRAYRKP